MKTLMNLLRKLHWQLWKRKSIDRFVGGTLTDERGGYTATVVSAKVTRDMLMLWVRLTDVYQTHEPYLRLDMDNMEIGHWLGHAEASEDKDGTLTIRTRSGPHLNIVTLALPVHTSAPQPEMARQK